MSKELVRCSKCKKSYPKNEVSVWKHTYNKKYLESCCRNCLRERQQLYRKTKSGRLAESRASSKSYQKHKHKWLARAKVRYAIKKGFIIKPKKCEVCEEVRPLQGHHEDYSKPLEVIFLCYGCHADADKELIKFK